ncbi:MAG TPA: hypothetical protein VLK25_08865 [Allosphingosinicella sp.]|nr:hypothetical protein [Allosphingosinicella sp.]
MRLPDRLPTLSGPGRLVFTLVWLPSLAAASIAPLGGAWFRTRAIATPSEAVSLGIDLLPSALLVVTAILLYLRRRQDGIAALLSLSFLMMSAAFFASEGFFRAIELGWVRDLFAHAGRAMLILVLLTFPDGRFSPRWSVFVAAGLLVWALIAFFQPWPRDVEYIGYLAFLTLGVLSIAIPYRRLSPGGRERQQVRWVLFGFAAGTALLAAATVVSLLPGGASTPGVKSWTALAAQSLAALGMTCFALGLIVSLLRYRLYDADAAISRSAGYALLTLLLGLTFAVSAKSLEYLVETYFGQEAGGLPGAVAAGLAVLLITPLNDRVLGWAERRFNKGLVALRQDLPECMADLRETGELDELIDEVLDRVTTGVRAARTALLIGPVVATRGTSKAEVRGWAKQAAPDEGVESLDCRRGDPLFPMRIPLRVRHARGKPLGWLLLGPRPDGSFYGKDERDALAGIADPVGRALQVVLRREAREARTEARLAALEAKLGADA